MDHPSVAFAYKIEAKASEYGSNNDEEEIEFESYSKLHDMCGVWVFGWGFFCDF